LVGGLDRSAALVALARVYLLNLPDLIADDLPASLLVLEERRDLPRPLALLRYFVLNHEDFEACQPIQLQLQNRISLLRIQVEALHDLLRRVRLPFGLADDLDDLVERVEDLLESLEDVDAFLERVELVLETTRDDFQTEV